MRPRGPATATGYATVASSPSLCYGSTGQHPAPAPWEVDMADPKFECHKCKKETEVANVGKMTWCEECCPDHDYAYDPGDRTRYCVNCGAEPPYDWHGYDPVDY